MTESILLRAVGLGRLSTTRGGEMSATRHGCADVEQNREGWWEIQCDCGAAFGGMPDLYTAIDELVDHAVAAGCPPPESSQG